MPECPARRSFANFTGYRVGLVCLALAFATAAAGQMTIEDASFAPFDPESLIRDVFLGDGVEVISVDYAGEPVSLGYFEGGNAAIGLDRGVVLTTGRSASRPGAGNAGAEADNTASAQFDNGSTVRDPNLEQIAPYLNPTGNVNIHNVSRYRVTFRPKGDRVSFRYVFASEEYPDFVCSEFNDVFGFFISGPGFAGPYAGGAENIALIPGTTLPVTINSVNGGVVGNSGVATNCAPPQGSLANAAYYRDNTGSPAQAPVYDGLTTVLTAAATVIPCEVYTIEITIGDIRDVSYDSGVFLEAESFETPTLDVEIATSGLGNELAEGCDQGSVTFVFNEVDPNPRTVTFTTSGTAVSGDDYEPIPSSVTVPPFQRSVTVPIRAYEDNLAEGIETLTISVQLDACTNADYTINLTDRQIVPIPAMSDTTVCPGAAAPLDATLPLPLDSPRDFDNTQSILLFSTGTPFTREIDVVGVDPNVLVPGALTEVCVDVQHARAEDLDIYLFSPAGRALELTTDNGAGATDGEICFTAAASRRIDDPANTLPFTGAYLPEGDWDDILRADEPVNGTWRLQVTDDENGGVGVVREWRMRFAARYELDYAWSPAAGLFCSDCPDPMASPSATTDYTVVVTDSYGCTETSTVRVGVHAPPQTPVISCAPSIDEVTFNWPDDANAVRFEVSTDGGSTFADLGTATSFTVDGLGVGTTVTAIVKADGECAEATATGDCTTQPCPALTLSATATDASCGGYADGEAVFTAGGGLSPYTYTLDGVSNQDGRFGGLAAGVKSVAVVDANGCSTMGSVTVGEPAGMTTSTSVTPSMVCGDPYEATAFASGGGGAPYAYTWSDGQAGATVGFSVSGTYTVRITDATGCEALDSVTIAMPVALTGAFPVVPISCASADDARIRLVATGGTPPYSYELDGVAQSVSTFDNLEEGTTYVAVIRDARGCTADTIFVLSEPQALTVAFTHANVSCAGGADGYLKASVTNARGPLTYIWTGRAEATDSLSGIPAGSYTLTARDSAGCEANGTFVITEPQVLTATATTDSVDCHGAASGGVQVAATGGTPPYLYAFDGGGAQTSPSFGGLVAGAYTVNVTDGNACATPVTIAIGEPAPLSASHQASVVSCAGASDGGLDLRVSGGRQPYTLLWSDGTTTEDRTGLPAGAYAVAITDASGCEFAYSVVLDDPAPVRINAAQTDVTCYGYDDGAIATAVTGGRTPYRFEWSGPGGYAFFGPNPQGLTAGSYEMMLRDVNGCGFDTTFAIAEPTAIVVQASTVDSICNGARDGRAYVEVSGGTAPFTYDWSSGETTDTASALAAGTATVTVTDVQGCEFGATTEVPEVPAMTLALAQTPVACYRDSNGVVAVAEIRVGSRVAALTGFSYVWRGYQDSARAEIVGRGGGEELVLTARDARGCLVTDSIVVGEPAPVQTDLQLVSDVSCLGLADGVAAASVSGGVGEYGYTWSDGGTDSVHTDLAAGDYQLYVEDANGCRDTAAVVVREPEALSSTLASTAVTCFAPNTGRVDVEVSGGNVPYRYLWSNGAVRGDLDGLTAGTYRLLITDARGCERRDTVEVLGDVPVVVDVDVAGATCYGETDGSIALAASGGNGPYVYFLDEESGTRVSSFSFLAPGTYEVFAEDRDGCPSETHEVEVEEPQALIVDAGTGVEVELGDVAPLEAAVFNAVGEVSYRWSPRDSGLFECPTCAQTGMLGSYQGVVRVDVTDARGCAASDLLTVRITKTAVVRVPLGFSPNDDGEDDLLLVHGTSGTRIDRFEVFNRWGQLVYAADDFRVNDTTVGWDGTYLNTFAPTGTYIYHVRAVYPDGSLENFSGQTTLIR